MELPEGYLPSGSFLALYDIFGIIKKSPPNSSKVRGWGGEWASSLFINIRFLRFGRCCSRFVAGGQCGIPKNG